MTLKCFPTCIPNSLSVNDLFTPICLLGTRSTLLILNKNFYVADTTLSSVIQIFPSPLFFFVLFNLHSGPFFILFSIASVLTKSELSSHSSDSLHSASFSNLFLIL